MLYQPGSSSTAILTVLFGSSSTLTEIAGHETEKKKTKDQGRIGYSMRMVDLQRLS